MRLALLLAIVSCAGEPALDAVERRRIAMGLRADPVALKEAMAELERRGSLDWLRTGGAGGDEEPLRIENLLLRARPSEPSEPRFLELLADAREKSAALVRGVPRAREALLASCLACHAAFRKELGAPR